MSSRRSEWVGEAAARVVRAAARHSRAISIGVLLLAVAALACAALRLGVNADPQALLDPDLPFQRIDREFARHFPVLNNALLVVVDAESGEQARDAASALAERLRARTERFSEVYVPGTGPFFERNALLYRSVPELEEFSEHLARVQPILAELSASPDLETLARVLTLGVDAAAADPEAAAQLSEVFEQLSRAAALVYAERPLFVSWEGALLGGTSFDPTRRAVIVAQPVLDFERVLAAAPAIDAIRADAAALALGPERGLRVRVTGYPALNHEEMLGLVWDVGLSGVLSFAIVLGLLYAAFRSLPLVIAAAATLLVGLALTAGFAALAVGSLNLVSIAFAVMFIGLGVDYSIHLGLHYAEERRAGRADGPAMEAAAREVGEALLLCTGSTAIGFLAFVPTDYRGVGELGLISAVGMLVILALTLTFLPALLADWCHVESLPALPRGPAGRIGRLLERRAGSVAAAALLLGLAAALLAPRVRFDSNVVEMRNPDTESVQAFNDLLADSQTSPWYVDVLEPSLAAAEGAAAQLAALPEVERVATLRSYVPEDQTEKREILADAALLLETPAAAAGRVPAGREAKLAALRGLAAALDVEWARTSRSPLARSATLLRGELVPLLARLEQSPDSDAALARFEGMLLGRLPARLAQLRRLLDPEPVTLEGLPPELRERMVAADGSARVQVFPRDDLSDDRALARFVAAVRTVEPAAGGLPVNVVEFGSATARSLREASLLAFGAIAALLLLLWRRPLDVVLVLTPLGLAGLASIACMVLLDMPFNFANVIVLPLLLGMGVDSGIHLVERARLHGTSAASLSDSTTARAILFSALTTLVSFSNLSLSGHRGIASLGVLLTLGMTAMLVSTLLVLPALIALRLRLGEFEP
jgi:hopanoid biosynthesis associated RND transporter like protein HpnN